MRTLTAALTALLAVAALAVVLGGEGRAETACLPPDGGELPAHPEPGTDAYEDYEHDDGPGEDGDWVLYGRGWGHGTGMSQYGALGAALLGCSAADIIETYYPGAEAAAIPNAEELPDEVRVSLLRSGEPRWGDATVEAQGGTLTWDVPEPVDDDLEAEPAQPDEEAWTLEPVEPDDEHDENDDNDENEEDAEPGLLVLRDEAGDEVWRGGEPGDTVRLDVDADELGAVLPDADRVQAWDPHAYTEGTLRFVIPEGESDEVAGEPFEVSVAIGERGGVDAIDRYLYGLREVPSNWPGAAQGAQAIAARSFAAERLLDDPDADPHLDDSPGDQVYSPQSPDAWVEAVEATAGEVVVHEGDIVPAYYSSSHGGQSESSAFAAVYGSEQPYLQPIDDSRWEEAVVDSDFDNRNIAWTRTLTQDEITERLNAHLDETEDAETVGEVRAIDTPDPRGEGGRVGVPGRDGSDYGGVEIVGDDGEATISGWDFTTALELTAPNGLRSELFTVEALLDPDEMLPRLAGEDRIETAIAIAEDGWDTADEVLLASSADFPDALAAGVLAAERDAPLLLSAPDALRDDVVAALTDLEPERVTLLGGEMALDATVKDAAGQAVPEAEIDRLGGDERDETAAKIAAEARPDGAEEVAVAVADDFPDALAAAALAASSDRVPTLLTDSDALLDSTRAALADLDAQTVHLVGGTSVLGEEVESALEAEDYAVERFDGDDRLDTSRQVVADALDRDDREVATLASAANFPDALAGGAYAARAESVLALVPADGVADDSPVADVLTPEQFGEARLLGGTAAVSAAAHEDLARLLRGEG